MGEHWANLAQFTVNSRVRGAGEMAAKQGSSAAANEQVKLS